MNDIREEIASLRQESEWVLKEEVNIVINELHSVLTEAHKSFPSQIIPGASQDNVGRPDKYILSNTNGPQQVKCVLTLMGPVIPEAEMFLKLSKTQVAATQTKIFADDPWRLQQVQDAENHLARALSQVDTFAESHFTQDRRLTSESVLKLLTEVTQRVNRGRSCLAMPRRKTLPELVNNSQMNCLKPTLPNDMAVSFYVQAHKLVLSAYHLNVSEKTDISSRVQAECTVPWLNDILVLFTLALQLCQQLIDKISVFAQYEAELQTPLLGSPSPTRHVTFSQSPEDSPNSHTTNTTPRFSLNTSTFNDTGQTGNELTHL